MKHFYAFLLLTLFSITNSENVRKTYKGYKMLRTEVKTAQDLKALVDISYGPKDIIFLDDPGLGKVIKILESPEEIEFLEGYLNEKNIQFSIQVEDMAEIVEREFLKNDELIRQADGRMSWDAYQTFEIIMAWLEELAVNHTDLVTLTTIGQSTEGRDLRLVKISKANGLKKLNYFIDSGIHSGEWIGHCVGTFVINELVTKSDLYANILDNIDFYIVPVVNPDGYVFTQTDRYWRKTRKNYTDSGAPNLPQCIGTDANRNFAFKWGGNHGSSLDHCSGTFRGPEAYSEPETKALSDWILANMPALDFKVYLNFHCCGQYWLIPYGFHSGYPVDFLDMKKVADDAIKELYKYRGTKWSAGHSGNAFYSTTGSSHDWAYGEAKIKYSYSPELPSPGNSDPTQIEPVCQETWLAVQHFAKHILIEFSQEIQPDP